MRANTSIMCTVLRQELYREYTGDQRVSIPVTGAVRAGKVYGTQFHPEKSGDTGLRILKAFAEL